MKFSPVSIIAILLIVTAVAIAGCTGSSQSSSATSGATAGGSAAGSSAVSGSVSGSDVFGTVDYNWVEYRTTSSVAGKQMSIYMKWTKSGKCSMRFEGAGTEMMQGMPTEMDCSATGSTQAQSDPNAVSPDVKLVKVGTETVTVPAGTFVTDKYTVSTQGMSATYWIAAGKPLIKMQGGNAEGSAVTELNGWG